MRIDIFNRDTHVPRNAPIIFAETRETPREMSVPVKRRISLHVEPDIETTLARRGLYNILVTKFHDTLYYFTEINLLPSENMLIRRQDKKTVLKEGRRT